MLTQFDIVDYANKMLAGLNASMPLVMEFYEVTRTRTDAISFMVNHAVLSSSPKVILDTLKDMAHDNRSAFVALFGEVLTIKIEGYDPHSL